MSTSLSILRIIRIGSINFNVFRRFIIMTAKDQTIEYLNARIEALEKALQKSVELMQSNPNRQQIDEFIKSVGYENRNKTK